MKQEIDTAAIAVVDDDREVRDVCRTSRYESGESTGATGNRTRCMRAAFRAVFAAWRSEAWLADSEFGTGWA